MDSGLSNRTVLLIVGGLCLMASAGALASQVLKNQIVALLSVLGVIALLVVTRLFGHSEFLLVKERFLDFLSSFRRGDSGRVHQSVVHLQGSTDWNELWQRVVEVAELVQFKSVCLDVNAPSLKEGYHARWGRVHSDLDTPCYWRTEIPLSVRGQIVGRLEVLGQRNGELVNDALAPVAKLVQDLESAMADLTGPAEPPNLNPDRSEQPAEEPVQSL